MKKLLTSLLVAFIALSGCASSSDTKQTVAQQIVFTGLNNSPYKATLISSDEFESAVFTDTNGNKFKLNRAVSGSGVRLTNENGVDIHFAKGEGVLNLGQGASDITLSYDPNGY